MNYSNAVASWWKNDLDDYHRIDGPAIEWADGAKIWFIDGVPHTEEEFNEHPLVVMHRFLTS